MSPWTSYFTIRTQFSHPQNKDHSARLTGLLWGLNEINEVTRSVNSNYHCYVINQGFRRHIRTHNCGKGRARANPRKDQITESYDQVCLKRAFEIVPTHIWCQKRFLAHICASAVTQQYEPCSYTHVPTFRDTKRRSRASRRELAGLVGKRPCTRNRNRTSKDFHRLASFLPE